MILIPFGNLESNLMRKLMRSTVEPHSVSNSLENLKQTSKNIKVREIEFLCRRIKTNSSASWSTSF
jgi:hypothetical protein